MKGITETENMHISSVGKPIIAMLELFGRIRMMRGPLSTKVNNFCLLSAGSGETEPPILTLILATTMETNNRFVVKPECCQQCILTIFD